MAKQKSLEEIEEMKKWNNMSWIEQSRFSYEQEFGKGSTANMPAGCGSDTVDNNERFRGLR